MYNAAIDRYEWNKLQGKNRYVAQLHSPSSRSSLCTDPTNVSWGGGGGWSVRRLMSFKFILFTLIQLIAIESPKLVIVREK